MAVLFNRRDKKINLKTFAVILTLLTSLGGCAAIASPDATVQQERAECRKIDAQNGFPKAVDFVACLQRAERPYFAAKGVPQNYLDVWMKKTTATAQRLDNKKITTKQASADWDKAYAELRQKTERYFAQQAAAEQAYLNSPEHKVKECQNKARYSSINPSVQSLRAKACQFLPYDTAAYLELERQATALEMQDSANDAARQNTWQKPSVTTNCTPTGDGGMWCSSY